MKKRDLFSERVSPEFRDRVMRSAEPKLAHNREEYRGSLAPWFRSLGIPLVGAGAAASAIVAILLARRSDEVPPDEQAIAFMDSDFLENEELLEEYDLLEQFDLFDDDEIWKEADV